jgi:hypothetical protein
VTQKVLPYSNLFIDLLVKKLEECSSDGIDCGHCLVAGECTTYWDTICQQQLDEYQYSDSAARLAELRDRKWNLAGEQQTAGGRSRY